MTQVQDACKRLAPAGNCAKEWNLIHNTLWTHLNNADGNYTQWNHLSCIDNTKQSGPIFTMKMDVMCNETISQVDGHKTQWIHLYSVDGNNMQWTHLCNLDGHNKQFNHLYNVDVCDTVEP